MMRIRLLLVVFVVGLVAIVSGCSSDDTEIAQDSAKSCKDCMEYPANPLADKIDLGNPQRSDCQKPDEWQAPDVSTKKFAMNLLHFNIQYVAGGLKGFGDPVEDEPGGLFAYDEFQIEDLIIEQSFVPVIDFYMDHPSWHATIELQGYMLDILAKRYPEVLDKLRTLVANRQIELVSFHWSDELFLAYTSYQSERSIELTDDSFRAHCLDWGRSVFTQEGQFAPAMADIMSRHDRDILLLPKNLFKYQHLDLYEAGVKPWYVMDGYPNVKVVVVGAGVHDDVEVEWTFFNDGELLATNDQNPYFGRLFQYSPEAMDEYKQKLQDLEDRGFVHVTISEYAKALDKLGIEPQTLPVLHGGDWQPKNTRNVNLWMGGCMVTCATDSDNKVLTGNFAVMKKLYATQIALSQLLEDGIKSPDLNEMLNQLDWAWRYHLLAAVSDATGWNPFVGEIEYSFRYSALANSTADAIIDRILYLWDKDSIVVDLDSGKVVDESKVNDLYAGMEKLQDGEDPVFSDPPLSISTDQDRPFSVSWYSTPDANRYVLEISFGKLADGDQKSDHGVYVRFPRFEDYLEFVPALDETKVVRHAMSDYSFQKGETTLSAPTGLFGIGNDICIIQNHDYEHLSVIYPAEDEYVEVSDKTLYIDEEAIWRFDVLKNCNRDDALALARRINTHSYVVLHRAENQEEGN